MNHQFCTQCGERLEPDARFCIACGTAVSSHGQSQSAHKKKPDKKTIPWPLLLLIVGPILIAAGVGFSLWPDSSPPTVEIPDEHDAAGLPYPGVPRISVEEAKERLDSGTAVVVDVRSSEEYAEAHIVNAVSIPLGELQLRGQELAPDADIITYCT